MLTPDDCFPSSVASPAPWLAKKMEHSNEMTSIPSSSKPPSKLGNETLAAASLDLQ